MKERFRMSDAYEAHSGSQLSVGARVIQERLPEVIRARFAQSDDSTLQRFSLLDVACGPGVLTADALQVLRTLHGGVIPASWSIHVDGRDIDQGILERSRARAQSEQLPIAYHAGDFRQPPAALRGAYDIVFSNEGLHWMGPLPDTMQTTEAVFYRHLLEAEQVAYAAWAAGQWRETMSGIAKMLRPNGYALLQFGSEGQLGALFTLMEQIFSQPRFQRYKTAIWFPLYYPKSEELTRLVEQGGLRVVAIDRWNEPLAEHTPEGVTQFVRGWTEPFFSAAMTGDYANAFYAVLREHLADQGQQWISRTTWCRTVVIAQKDSA